MHSAQGVGLSCLFREGPMQSRAVHAVVGALSVLLLSSLAGAEGEDLDVRVRGNLRMRNSTDVATGHVLKNGVPLLHNYGTNNTCLGLYACNLPRTDADNTASGVKSLLHN